MRNLKLALLAFLITPFLISCDEDEDNLTIDDDEVIELTSTCKIDQITRTENGYASVHTYHYDGDKITKITDRNEGASEDNSSIEVTYNTDGTYQKIEEFSDWGDGYQLRRLYTYTYNTDGKISVMNQTRYDYSEAYNSTTTITYEGGNPVSVISTGADNMKVTDITFEDGNMKTAKLDFNGDGSVVVDIIITSDDKYNNAKHDLPTENILDFYNENNMISVEFVNAFTMGETEVPAGSKIVDRTLTYTAEGEVLKMIDHPTIFDGDNGENRTKDFAYICN